MKGKHSNILITLFLLITIVLPDDYSDQYVNDASDLFNEQGLIGNSYDSNGKISINNFNGNLVYTRPLFYSPGPNGLDLNIILTYNQTIRHLAPDQYL